jgi:hypothetical protein
MPNENGCQSQSIQAGRVPIEEAKVELATKPTGDARRFEHPELEVVEGVGHFPRREMPTAMSQRILVCGDLSCRSLQSTCSVPVACDRPARRRMLLILSGNQAQRLMQWVIRYTNMISIRGTIGGCKTSLGPGER